MRANSRRRQHGRSRRSQPETYGRLEIRKILVNYYIDTRGHRRSRLTFQESLRAVATMTTTPAASSPPSLTSRPLDAHLLGDRGRDVNDEESRAPKPNIDSLTFSSIAAASTALHEKFLDVGCSRLDTLDGHPVQSPGCGSQLLMATPTRAIANAMVARHLIVAQAKATGRTTSQDASSITDSVAIPRELVTAIETTHVDSTPVVPRIGSATGCLRPDADQPDRFYACTMLRGGLARVMNVNSVYAKASDQRLDLFSHPLVAQPCTPKASETRVARSIHAIANMDKLRSDSGGIQWVLPIFPPLERWSKPSQPAPQQAMATRSPLPLPVAKHGGSADEAGREVLREVKRQAGNGPLERACSVVLTASFDTPLRSPVLRALSLISVRLGYRGSVAVIAKSMTSQNVMRKPWSDRGDQAMPQLVLPASAGRWEGDPDHQPIIAMPPRRWEDPSQSNALTANWVAPNAA